MRKTICIILAAVMMIAIATSAFAGTITVSGTGEVLVPADTAIISLGVTVRNKDVLTAQAEVNEAIAKVRAAKNIPSRFSPVMIASSSATSATIAWGIMPSSAIGKAAITTIIIPGMIPVSPGTTPISAVMT